MSLVKQNVPSIVSSLYSLACLQKLDRMTFQIEHFLASLAVVEIVLLRDKTGPIYPW